MRSLETKRLLLRDWRESDLEDAFVFWSNPNVTIPEGATPRNTVNECKPVLEYLISVKNNYAVVLKSTGHVVGSIGLNKDAKGNENARNLGFCLAEEYWNQGLITEALNEIILYAKEITSILSATHNKNQKTEHILRKLGFQQVDIIYNVKRNVDSQSHDDPYYTLKF